MPMATATLIPESLLGPAAGVATSVLWVITTLFFTAAARRLGSTAVNITRLALAVLLLGVTHRLLAGSWWPEVGSLQLAYLAASGVLGLAICDQCLFTAFLDLGPRRALLVMTTSPIFALLFGAVFLAEHVSAGALGGIALTLAGVVWVVLEREPVASGAGASAAVGAAAVGENVARGVLLATIAAALQAAGAWLAKQGMGHGLEGDIVRVGPQAATYVRMVFGFLGLLPWVLFGLRRHGSLVPRSAPAADHPALMLSGLALAAAGAVVGPFLGVWASLIAFDRAPIGIAQTLCSLAPVLILPVVAARGERVSRRAVIGALVAVVGSALLFLV